MVKWCVNNAAEFKEVSHKDTIIRFENQYDVLNKESNFVFYNEQRDAENAIYNIKTHLSLYAVTYYINEYGFRGHWDLMTDKKKVIFFGCSFTFGWGLNEEDQYHTLISNELFDGYEIINISAGGWSTDSIVRFFKYITDFVRGIEYCFFILPPLFRTELPVDDVLIDYITMVVQKENISKKYLHKYENWLELNDELYEKYRTMKNISHIQALAKSNGIKPFIGTYDSYAIKYFNEIVPSEQLLPYFEQYEQESRNGYGDETLKHKFARDGQHPGVYSNKKFAEEVIKKIKL
jgi:hypothetical protein